jgi:phosphate transport system substrate-binding protein
MKYFLRLLIILVLFWSGCSSTPVKNAEIRIKGSDTMLKVMRELAREFSEINPGVSIFVEGGGTSLGVKSLSDRTIDICSASRSLMPEETKILAEKYGSIGISTYIARDAICILVNKSNPINNLTFWQLKEIFTGKITNWKEIGGNDTPIEPVRRNDNSGTATHFKTRVLEEDSFGQSVSARSSVENLLEEIEENKNAIGFSGLVHSTTSKVLSVDGIYPTEENIKNMNYPLSRYLHFYTISSPTGIIKDFIDWVLGPKGQKIIKDFGFVSLYNFSY